MAPYSEREVSGVGKSQKKLGLSYLLQQLKPSLIEDKKRNYSFTRLT